jgi:cell division control protein 45
LFQNDYIEHQIHPVAGYQDLERLNNAVVKDKEGLRFVICLGLGGLVDLSAFLELPEGAECWVIDGRRPWNLYNVYGGREGDRNVGKVSGGRYGVGELGGIKCFDDGDIEEEMSREGEAFSALIDMPEVDDDSDSEDGDESSDEEGGGVRITETPDREDANGRKRKSSDELGDSDDEDGDRSRRQRRDSAVSLSDI